MFIPLHQYFVFISIVTMIVVTPGPNLALLLANSPSNTKLTGFGMVFGFAAAIVSHAALALVGVGAVIAASAILFTVMKLFGAAYLIWLGTKSLLSLRRLNAPVINPSRVSVNLTAKRAFVRGYLSNFLNPKPAIFYVAVFPQFLEGRQQDVLGGAPTGRACKWRRARTHTCSDRCSFLRLSCPPGRQRDWFSQSPAHRQKDKNDLRGGLDLVRRSLVIGKEPCLIVST